jgi:2,3-bisphosphoglycerate-independent phosphoglycerate mutase
MVLLMILDGWGLAAPGEGNAVARARTPHLDGLTARYPHTRLRCDGEAVGLPRGIMGNSEVGHLNIGAGRIVFQDLLRIDHAIRDESISRNPALTRAMDRAAAGGGTLHLMGLVSDGGVHSQLTHLEALIRMARQRGVAKVRVHAVTDGRDTPPTSGAGYLSRLQNFLGAFPDTRIATICGRFFAMDRDTRWDRVETAYRLYTRGEGRPAGDPVAAVQEAYAREETDEFIRPIVLLEPDGTDTHRVRTGDSLVCFNFRADRVREITRALTAESFAPFAREPRPTLADYVCMTVYDEAFNLPVAFPPVRLDGLLGEVVSRHALAQLRIAETEKYAHVTYFFNGGEEAPFPGEERCLIPSPRGVATYDQKPEMSAPEVTREAETRIRSRRYRLIVLNFANMDMVGHTGNLEAAVRACETVDHCVGALVGACLEAGGVAMVTADHGNAEQMLDHSGAPFTAHTTNPVPFVLVDPRCRELALRTDGRLGDIAPTVLAWMGLPAPTAMTGRSLVAGTPARSAGSAP